MTSKRVAIVAYSAPPLSSGGVASAHFNLFQAMRKGGLEAKLFTFGDTQEGDDQVGIERSGGPKWWLSLLRLKNRWLFKLIQPGKRAYQVFDILSSQWGAKRMAGKIQEYDPDVIILSDHGAPGRALRPMSRAKMILISHHNPARFLDAPSDMNYSSLDIKLALRLEQAVIEQVDLVLCPSAYMLNSFAKTYSHNGPIKQLPNLIDPQILDSSSEEDLRNVMGISHEVLLLYLPSAGGALKGAQYLQPLISRLKSSSKGNIAFYVPGAIETKYQDQFGELETQADIYFPGHLPYEQNLALARQCDICISLSLMENFSMALLEAALLLLPILGFATGGNADIVHQGKNGFLYQLGDIDGMVRQVVAWQDRDSFSKFREKAANYSQKVHDPKIAQQAYLDLVTNL